MDPTHKGANDARASRNAFVSRRRDGGQQSVSRPGNHHDCALPVRAAGPGAGRATRPRPRRRPLDGGPRPPPALARSPRPARSIPPPPSSRPGRQRDPHRSHEGGRICRTLRVGAGSLGLSARSWSPSGCSPSPFTVSSPPFSSTAGRLHRRLACLGHGLRLLRPDRFDLAGAALCPDGIGVIMYAPRGCA